MTATTLIDAAGRARSPATMPNYRTGKSPANKGRSYPADPPRVEEIVAVMREAGESTSGIRTRALVAVLWRAGLRVQEALDLSEADLEPDRGALLVRSGKGGKRREVGMDSWGWEHLNVWLNVRQELPVGPLFCVIAGPTRGRPWSSSAVRSQLRRLTTQAGVRRRFAPHQLRRAHAVGSRGRARERDPTPAEPRESRNHLDLPERDRQRRDHRHCPRAQCSADTCGRRAVMLRVESLVA